MIDEVRQICDPSKGGDFMDCTFGGGGYSKELLKYKNTNITALDRDKKALVIAKDLQKKFYPRFSFFNQKFSNLDKVVKKKFDAVIFDLGLSSIQLDDLSRGFSFKSKSDLDMTMGLNDVSVKSVLNKLKAEELKMILKKFGDEKEAFKIAKNIVKTRAFKTISTTDELVQIIKKSKKKIKKKELMRVQKLFKL